MANGYDILDWVYVGIFGGGAALVFTVLALVKGFRFAHWLLLEIFRGPILLLIDAVAALGAHISKAVHLAFNRPSPDTFRRRDLISRYPVRHAYPSVISNKDESSLEKLLAIYGRYLNLKANIPCTNATVFRIRSWLQNCEKNHNGKDGRPPCHPVDDENRRGFPLWLIDIEQRCLVPYQYSMTYIALSYVWGNVETAQTLSSNLDCLRKPQSLLGPHAEVKLPITVSDAMFLTGFVGCRYLWCDRLCIVQDDAESKHSQIRQMAEIYARSFCTIIASDNLSANSGLHGIPNLSPKALEESTDVLDKTKFAWSARAWTFQEELFSTRLIWLSSGQVSWQCLGLHYPESSRRYNDSKHPNSRLLGGFDHLSRAVQIGGMLCPQSPEPHFYMALAKGFSRRFVNERYPEDRFHAFSSVELALEEVYPGVFIQCIPECIFSTCMLWSLDVSSSSRIQIKVGSSGKRSASWSWIDWSNSVNFSRLESRDFGGTCRSLVSWRVSQQPKSASFSISVAERGEVTRSWTCPLSAEANPSLLMPFLCPTYSTLRIYHLLSLRPHYHHQLFGKRVCVATSMVALGWLNSHCADSANILALVTSCFLDKMKSSQVCLKIAMSPTLVHQFASLQSRAGHTK